MSLENLVPDLPSCKKLPKGMETYFVWDYPSKKQGWSVIERWMVEDDSTTMIPAPIAQELMAIMPITIRDKQKGWFRRIETSHYKNRNGEVGFYAEYNEIRRISNPNLAQALADLYNWCVDEGRIEKEVKLKNY